MIKIIMLIAVIVTVSACTPFQVRCNLAGGEYKADNNGVQVCGGVAL